MSKSLFILCFILSPVFLFGEYFTIKEYHTEMRVNADGSLFIEENILVNFTEKRRGIIRSIPLNYSFGGKKHKLKIKNVKSKSWNIKTYKQDGNYNIRFGDKKVFIDGLQSYVFTYEVVGSILNTENYQELFWDILGTEWGVEVKHFSYKVSLPNDLQLGFNDYQVFSGSYGQKNSKVSMRYESGYLAGESDGILKPNEGASIAIKFPNNYFTADEINTSNKINDKVWPIALAALLSFLGYWFNYGKNKPIKTSLSTEHYPPDDLSPSQVGLLVDNIAHDKDLLSNIPYWANQSLIKITSINGDLMLEKLQPIYPEASLYEKTLFNGIFKNSDYVSLSSLKKKIYKDLLRAMSELSKEMYHTDYYLDKSQSIFRNYKTVILFFVFVLLGILSIVQYSWVITGILFIVLGVLSLVFRLLPPTRSETGELLVGRINSFKEFLENQDHPAYQKLIEEDPDYLHKMYPYAIALGIDKDFFNIINKYSGSDSGPEWFYMGGSDMVTRGSTSQFQENFNVETITSTFRSVPQSSGGSSGGSSSGGGFSGGGAGGGGGSSW